MIYKCFKIQIKYQKIRNYILCEDSEGYFMIFIYLFALFSWQLSTLPPKISVHRCFQMCFFLSKNIINSFSVFLSFLILGWNRTFVKNKICQLLFCVLEIIIIILSSTISSPSFVNASPLDNLLLFVTDTEKDSRKKPRLNNHNTSAYFQTLSLFSPYNSKRNKPPGKVKNWMIEEEKERDKRTGHAWACYRRIGWRIHPGQTVQEPAVRVNCSNFLLQRPFGIPPSPSHTAVVVSKYPVSDSQTSWTNPRTQVEVSKCKTPYIWAPSLRSFTSA